jgi:hypothetical protein
VLVAVELAAGALPVERVRKSPEEALAWAAEEEAGAVVWAAEVGAADVAAAEVGAAAADVEAAAEVGAAAEEEPAAEVGLELSPPAGVAVPVAVAAEDAC